MRTRILPKMLNDEVETYLEPWSFMEVFRWIVRQ